MSAQKKASAPIKATEAIPYVPRYEYNIISFPTHRRRGLATISELVSSYKKNRKPRGDYLTPLPDDIIDPESDHGR